MHPAGQALAVRHGAAWLGLLIAVGATVPSHTAQAPPAPSPADSVVLIRSTNSLRASRGSGFVIGDGSWVVTASHVVAADLGKGRRLGDRTAFVYSPWTGRPLESRLVVVDGVADIALLRLPAAGLPALPLEGLDSVEPDQALARLKERPLRLFGFPLAYGEDTVASLARASSNDSRLREIARREQTSLAVLGACPDVQPGWSGGPVVAMDSGAVVAVFHSLFRPRPEATEGFPAGSISGYLGELLKKAGVTDPASFQRPPPATLPRSPGAAERLAHEMRSMSWAAGGVPAKALEEQLEILKQNAEDYLPHLEIGRIHLQQKRYGKALEHLKEAVRLAPGSVSARILLGRAYHLEYEPKAAEAELKKAVEIAPDEAEARLTLAEMYTDNQRSEQAERTLREAMERWPEHPVVRARLAQLLLARAGEGEKGKAARAEALKMLAEASDLAVNDPSLFSVCLAYARHLETDRRYRDAEAIYLRVRKTDPENPLGYYHLARIMLLQNRTEEAQIHLNGGFRLKDLSEEMVQIFRALQLQINERGGN